VTARINSLLDPTSRFLEHGSEEQEDEPMLSKQEQEKHELVRMSQASERTGLEKGCSKQIEE
jgi:hypothetical protein